MTYQALARKWRPKTFSQVVAQEHVLSGITHSLEQQRLHHAYLFSGTRGVGKTSIARLFAKSLNCEQGVSAEPCGKCSNCIEVDQGNFVDLLEIDAASRTKVEDTRELLDNVQYSPARGRYKVYLIDEVHMLSRHSFNALLKTLEEPPEHVKFLLATTDPQKLPVTVLSRCLQFQLKALSEQQISEQLQHILEVEQQPFQKAAVQALSHAADGSMRDALSLTDQALALGGAELEQQQVLAMLGVLDPHLVKQLLCFIVAGQSVEAFAKIAELSALAPDYLSLHQQLAELLHHVAMAQVLPASQSDETILMLAEQLSAQLVQLLYQIATTGKRDLAYAPSPKTGFEMTVLRMLAFKPDDVRLAPSEPSVKASSTVVEDASLDTEQAALIEQAQQQGYHLHQHQSSAPAAEPNPSKISERQQSLAELKQRLQPATAADTIKAPAPAPAPAPAESAENVESALKPQVGAIAAAESSAGLEPQAEDDYYAELAAQAESLEQEFVEEMPLDYAEPAVNQPASMPTSAPPTNKANEAAPSIDTASLIQLHSQIKKGDTGKKPKAASSSADSAALVRSPSPAPVTLEAKVVVPQDKLSDLEWELLINGIDLGPIARQIALNSLLNIEESRVCLQLKSAFSHLPKPNSVLELQQQVLAKLGGERELVIETGEDPQRQTPLELQQARHQQRLIEAKQRLLSDPNVQFMQQHLGAELLEETVQYHLEA